MSEQPPRYNAMTPALSEEEWANRRADRVDGTGVFPIRMEDRHTLAIPVDSTTTLRFKQPRTFHAVIAACNALLPDSDPRKITREWVQLLRDEAERVRLEDPKRDNPGSHVIDPDDADRMADALESYLPPA